jgi:transposase
VRQGPRQAGKRCRLVETFGTTVPDLLAVRDWLAGLGVTHVAMESTGVYWKSPYYLLEDDFEMLLVNAAHVKHVPGRKTDTIDAAWLALLLSRGLLRASFVPPPPIRELRDLTRYRKALINERSREVNRIHKTLEDAGEEAVGGQRRDGASGRDMMRSLIAGKADPEALADLAKGKLRAKLPALPKALTARFGDHHAFLLQRMLAHVEDLESDIAALSERIQAAIAPFAAEIELLCTIPGVGQRGRRGAPGRDRAGHEPLPYAGPPRLLGRHVPRPARVGRQAGLGQDPQGLQVAAHRPGRVRTTSRSLERHLPVGAPCAGDAAARGQEGDHRRGPRDPRRRPPGAVDP